MKTKKEYFDFLKENNLKDDAYRQSIPRWFNISVITTIFFVLWIIPSILVEIFGISLNIEILVGIIMLIVIILITAYFIRKHFLWHLRDRFIRRKLICESVFLYLSKQKHTEDQFCKELFSFAKKIKQMTPYDNLKLKTTAKA